MDILNDPDYEVAYENHGWRNIKDIADELRANFGSGEQAVMVKTVNDSLHTGYAVTLMGMLLKDKPREGKHISCNVNSSGDGKNHIWLMRRRDKT